MIGHMVDDRFNRRNKKKYTLNSQRAITLVAVALLLLLPVSIRNSWALAIGVVSSRPDKH